MCEFKLQSFHVLVLSGDMKFFSHLTSEVSKEGNLDWFFKEQLNNSKDWHEIWFQWYNFSVRFSILFSSAVLTNCTVHVKFNL